MKWIFLIFWVTTFSSFGQKKMSLSQCLEYANRNNFDVKTQEITIAQSENTLEQSKKNVFPSINASLSQSLYSGKNIDPFSNTFVLNNINSSNYGLNVNWNIFNGYSVKNQINQNQKNLEAEHFELIRRKKDLKIKITVAYLQILLNQELWKISQEFELNVKNQLDIVKELVLAGNKPKTDIIDLEASLAKASYDVLNAKNNILQSKLSLAQLIGYKDFSNLEIENVKIEEKILSENIKDQINYNNQPIVKTYFLRENALKIGLAVAKAGKVPTLSLSSGLATTYSSAAANVYDYSEQLKYNMNQYYRLGLSIPIFSNGQIKSRINSANLNLKQAEIQYQQINIQIKQEIDQAYFAAKISFEKLQSAKVNFKTQNNSFESANERFKVGVINNTDLNTIRLNYENAKSNLAQAQYEYHFRRLLLDYYLE